MNKFIQIGTHYFRKESIKLIVERAGNFELLFSNDTFIPLTMDLFISLKEELEKDEKLIEIYKDYLVDSRYWSKDLVKIHLPLRNILYFEADLNDELPKFTLAIWGYKDEEIEIYASEKAILDLIKNIKLHKI